MDRPREDCTDEDAYVAECVGYLRGVRDALKRRREPALGVLAEA
jgi:hypothetical protein